jgi:hypothetical protein
MIKAITIDLWETLIEDVNSNEIERDERRAKFILDTLKLDSSKKDIIMKSFLI